LGTNEKLYILWGNSYYDITPVRKTMGPPGTALPNNPSVLTRAEYLKDQCAAAWHDQPDDERFPV
jgi:hypothetical protein